MVGEIYDGPPTAERPPARAAAPGDAWRRRLAERLPAARMAAVARLADGLAAAHGAGSRILWEEPGEAGLDAFLGALCAGLTVVPLPRPPRLSLDAATDFLDASAVIWPDGRVTRAAHEPRLPPSPDVRVILRSSATSGEGTWAALGDTNLLAVLDSHVPRLGLEGATVLSVLPWGHAFGLVLDLLASLLGGAALVRAPEAARDPVELARRLHDAGATHLNAVPIVLERLRTSPAREAARRLAGGIVGGAPVTATLAAWLAGSGLRAGYGCTEASPGITLGEPGEWCAGFLGRPVGCEVRLDWDDVLQFRGPNACVGTWDRHGLRPLPPGRWVWTGDYAREHDGAFVFEGRAVPTLKLANGRAVDVGSLEREVRALPGVEEAMAWSPDGTTLVVGISPPAALPDAAALRPTLHGAAHLQVRVVPVESAAWARTAKGELDRRRPPDA